MCVKFKMEVKNELMEIMFKLEIFPGLLLNCLGTIKLVMVGQIIIIIIILIYIAPFIYRIQLKVLYKTKTTVNVTVKMTMIE